jgi:hypothetical protein
MPDVTNATIEIGGTLTTKKLAKLVGRLDEYSSDDWEGTIADAIRANQPLLIQEDEAAWGAFPFEDDLQALRLSFRRTSGTLPEDGPSVTVYRATDERHCSADSDGDARVYVPIAYFDSAERAKPEVRQKIADARFVDRFTPPPLRMRPAKKAAMRREARSRGESLLTTPVRNRRPATRRRALAAFERACRRRPRPAGFAADLASDLASV